LTLDADEPRRLRPTPAFFVVRTISQDMETSRQKAVSARGGTTEIHRKGKVQMKRNYTIRDELEDIIDERGLSAVLSMIAGVCHEKAEHLRPNGQDESAAAVWLHAGYRVRIAAVSEAVKAASTSLTST
jgi:hypothetical protein